MASSGSSASTALPMPGTFANSIEANKATGPFVDPRAGRILVSKWAKDWLESVRPDPETGQGPIKPKTFASYESLLRSRVLPTFGRRQLASLRPSDVQAWVNKMQAEGLSRSRVRQAHVVLKTMLDRAERDLMIGRNPARMVKPPALKHKEAAYFEPDVVDKIVEATTEPYDVFIRVLGVLGLRFGEAAALRRRHLDVLRRRLHIEESLAEVGGRFVFGPTKSHATRWVPLSPVLAQELERHLDGVGEGPDALVFTGPKGGPLRYRYLYMRLWRPVLDQL
jgi:integrase